MGKVDPAPVPIPNDPVVGSLDRIVGPKEMMRITGKSWPTLWRWRRKGLLPPCVRTPSGSPGWLASEVAEWLSSLSKQPVSGSTKRGAAR